MSNTMYGHGPTRCASSHTMPSLDGEIDREYFIQCWQARKIGTSVGCRILLHILEEHEACLLSVVSQHNVTKFKTDVRYDEVLRRTFSRRWFYFSIQYLLGLLWHFQCLFLSRIVVLSICVRRYTLFFFTWSMHCKFVAHVTSGWQWRRLPANISRIRQHQSYGLR